MDEAERVYRLWEDTHRAIDKYTRKLLRGELPADEYGHTAMPAEDEARLGEWVREHLPEQEV